MEETTGTDDFWKGPWGQREILKETTGEKRNLKGQREILEGKTGAKRNFEKTKRNFGRHAPREQQVGLVSFHFLNRFS